jgi:hypothetical protein
LDLWQTPTDVARNVQKRTAALSKNRTGRTTTGQCHFLFDQAWSNSEKSGKITKETFSKSLQQRSKAAWSVCLSSQNRYFGAPSGLLNAAATGNQAW